MRNNTLRYGALFSLFVTSYLPLFLIVIAKQIYINWNYLNWGGWKSDALICFVSNFGMACFLSIVSISGIIGAFVLLRNLKKNIENGNIVVVKKINNRNSEAIGYIATYIVPFIASDFTSLFECTVFIVMLLLIYVIYTNSNLLLINPILNIKYSLIEIEYSIVGDNKENNFDALVITETKDFKENVHYKIYPIGFKLYYGKERDK